MKVSLKWLADYVDIEMPTDVLARRLTESAAEVEAIERTGGWDREHIFVGRVLDVTQHPNADRLRLATVDFGSGPQTVVCGAPNVAKGQNIAFATVGAHVIDGHTGTATVLKAAKIRGVESAGMVMSERELGLSDQHEGILVLPDDAPVGTPLADYLGDTVLDIGIAANRPDLMSMVGVAREVAALSGSRVREPDLEVDEQGALAAGRIAVEIADPDLCPRYTATLIDNVKVGPSPAWMQERLIAAGMRPINNVVDVTNYVMLEMGQPLHAFDLSKIRGGKIIVRRAGPDERLTTLDGVERVLGPDMLVIADTEGAVALAGVMGGLDSEVSEATTSVLLESASFNPTSIRRTSTQLKARSEASSRFERGPGAVLPAMAARRAAKLIAEVSGGIVAPGVVDAYPAPVAPPVVTLTRDRLRTVLGTDVPRERVTGILGSLGFNVEIDAQGSFVVTSPYWRTDIHIPEDVIEEISRVLGYSEIPSRALHGGIPAMTHQAIREFREEVKDVLAAAGMQETITYSLTTTASLARVMPEKSLDSSPPLRALNPISSDHEYLRTSLRASVLESAAGNLRLESGPLALFEAGRVYLPQENDLPDEREIVTGVVTGHRLDRWGRPTQDGLDFFDAKACTEYLFESLGVDADYADVEEFGLLPGRTAALVVAGERVGVLGQVHPQIALSFEIESDLFLFEIDLARLMEAVPERRVYRPVSRFPAVDQDLALVVDEGIPATRVTKIIADAPLVKDVRPFDVYQGGAIPPGKKSLAFALSFQAPDRTLTDNEVTRARERILQRLKRELGAELR
jgi:phenylalanyl-tRNA synthetase beta chain